MPGGARVPGTAFELDPVQAAFNIGAMVRWLDFNDTWLAAEWGHPSDNLGGILAVADWLAAAGRPGESPPRARRAHRDDQGPRDPGGARAREQLQPRRARPRAAGARRLHRRRDAAPRRQREQVINAVSNAWIDGRRLRTYRHAPNTGSRKSWAAGDATSRAVRLALIALTGETGYPARSRAEVGFLRRALPGRQLPLPAALRHLRHGERAVQDFLSGRVPRPDRGRMRGATASAGAGTAWRTSSASRCGRRSRRCASSARRARFPTRRTATTASNTWWPCR